MNRTVTVPVLHCKARYGMVQYGTVRYRRGKLLLKPKVRRKWRRAGYNTEYRLPSIFQVTSPIFSDNCDQKNAMISAVCCCDKCCCDNRGVGSTFVAVMALTVYLIVAMKMNITISTCDTRYHYPHDCCCRTSTCHDKCYHNSDLATFNIYVIFAATIMAMIVTGLG